jgi:class 3 adenylate cyclase/predicted ATPase
MFCDLAGSTELSTRLDPEDLRRVLAEYQKSCADIIHRFGGHVAKYLGDGVLAYFGYPQAHEDDADRAVQAGLAIALGPHRLKDTGSALAVRVGIATGEVVVGDNIEIDSARELAVVGEAPNLAARLQAVAQPRSVLISDLTRRLARGGFVFSGPQELALKGFADPVVCWTVHEPGSVPLRSASALLGASSKLVGRQAELALLIDRLDAACSGDGQVLLLTGGPGMGKSRLSAALIETAQSNNISIVSFTCSPYHQSSELKPLASWIEREAGIVSSEPSDLKLVRLEKWLETYGARIHAGLFAALLSLPTARDSVADLAPGALRQKTLEVLEKLLLNRETSGPLLLMFEDIHWIDPTSGELLTRLVDQVNGRRLLIVTNARPEFEAAWARLPQVTVLALNRLGSRDATLLIRHVARAYNLTDAVLAQILARAQGNPLFLEELTKAVVDDFGSAAAAAPAIPATLRDSLMERLDRLGVAKETAQAAAAIGHEFDDRILAAVTLQDDTTRRRSLDRLLDAEIITRRGNESSTAYAFRHALIQEAAYNSLLKSTRREYHRRIAEGLEQGVIPEVRESEPERIARQYSEAGMFDRAIEFWHAAGTRAAQRSANAEAIAQLGEALELLRKQGPESRRNEKELALLNALGPCLMATRGWNAPEVREVYERAFQLGRETGRSAEIFPAAWGRWLTAHAGGEAESARRLMQQLFDLIEDHDDTNLLLQAHHAAASTRSTDCELSQALSHIEAGTALYSFQVHRHQAMRYGGHDPCVCMQCMGALDHMLLGHASEAERRSQAAQSLAAEVAHEPSIAHARNYRAELMQILGDPQSTIELADLVLPTAVDKGMSQYAAWAKMMRGWSLAASGNIDRGLGELNEGVASLRATGVLYHFPHRLGMRAQAYAMAGPRARAIEAVEEALQSVEQTGERWYEPELLRIKARILAAAPHADHRAAVKCLDEAITKASERNTKLWEGRARVDLALLLAKDGKQQTAADIIRPMRAWDRNIDVPEMEAAHRLQDRLGH